jgi:monoamine oxidase
MQAEPKPLTRRRFFEQLAAIGGMSLALAGMDALGFGFSSAMAAPPSLEGGAKGTRVVVLGAGVAGLTAAYELGRAGYAVTVLEARPFAGGRVQTAKRGFTDLDLNGNRQVCDFDEGLYINVGPWRIPYWHRSTLHYVRRFKVPVELFNNDNDAAYMFMEKGSGPLAGKPVRKGMIAADARATPPRSWRSWRRAATSTRRSRRSIASSSSTTWSAKAGCNPPTCSTWEPTAAASRSGRAPASTPGPESAPSPSPSPT